MDGDDDICVLPDYSEDEVDDYPHPSQCVIPFSPLSPVPDFDRGSHHALQKAYADVKRRLNESNTKNQLLARRVRELVTTKNSDSYIGNSYDMMDDVSSRGQGAAETQMAAEEGYSNNLQRQLTRARSQIQAVEKKYQETVQEMNSKLDTLSQQLQEALAQVASLSQENLRLQQGYEAVRREREVAVQAVQELKQRCESLEIEKDKVMKERASLHLLLKKAEQEEAALLKEKQGDSLSSEPPAELVAELANMRTIIDSLKKMVLAQRDFLARRGMSMSMQSSLSRSVRDPPSAEPTTTPPSSGRSGGSHSGHSWEIVNGVSALTLDPRQQQQQQQMMVQQQSVTSTSSRLSPPSDHQEAVTNLAAAHKPMVSGGGSVARMSPAVAGHMGPAVVGQKSKTEIIQRRKSEDNVVQPRSRTEMIRVPQSPRLAEHMDSHYQQQQQVGAGMVAQLGPTGLIQLQQGSVGLSQLQQEVSRPGPSELAQGLTTQPRAPHHLGVQYPPGPYTSQRQTSPTREPPSTYDNLTLGNGNHVGTAPPAHLLNGACFVQNSADSFGSSGGSTMTLAPQQPGLAVAMRRDGGSARGSPQEHTDFTQPLDRAHPDLNSQLQEPVQFENGLPAGEAAAPNLDRKCPVCGQDFSHISMDEFQTHVFECFDDAEEANAPETLQPQNSTKQSSGSANRICPMCEKQFPESVTQQFFEGHVQSHFDEIDPFEVLHPQQA